MMINVIDIIEYIHNLNFSFAKKPEKTTISFLNDYKNDKILLLGYENHRYNYDCIPIKKESLIIENLDKYTLFVIHKDFCKLSRVDIERLLDLFKIHNKKVIFCGYGSYLNLNIENSKNMFRPIDITKYPFSIDKKYKVIKKSIAKGITSKYLLLLVFTILTNIYGTYRLYRINLILILLLLLIFPYHKYVLVDFSK